MSRSRTGREYAAKKPEEFTDRARDSMAEHVQAMVEFQDAGAEVFDYGNSIRDEARQGGYERAFDFPGFVPAYIRPLFCEGKGPFRWAALSGDPADIDATDRAVMDLFPDNDRLQKWMRGAREQDRLPGPAGPDLLAGLRRAGPGRAWRSTTWSPAGEVSAPIVIGRDHLDCGSVASPYRETESMLDGSDAIADWPLLNAMINTAVRRVAGCRSTTAAASASAAPSTPGRSALADGTDLAAQKLARVLTNDPGMGVIRHVDAGYDRADEVAPSAGVRIPMREGELTAMSASPFDGMWSALRPVGRDPSTGGYRRLRLDRGRPRAARVVRRRGARRAGWTWSRTGWATSGPGGATRTPTQARRRRPARIWTAFPTAARSTARWAWSAPSPRSTPCGSGGSPGPPGRRGQLRRRGRRPVRRRLRRLAGDHRRADRRPGPRPHRRRRHHHGRGDARAPGRRPDDLGPDPEALRPDRPFVELHVEQGRGLVDLGRAGGRGRPSGRTAAGGSTSRRGQPRRHHPAGRPAGRDARARRPRCSPPAAAAERTAAWPPSAR